MIKALPIAAVFISAAGLSPALSSPQPERMTAIHARAPGETDSGPPISRNQGLIEKAALVTKENREIRTKENTQEFADAGIDLEGIQGRFWCLKKNRPPIRPNETPAKARFFKDYRWGNATVVFNDDVVLLNRHMFTDENGQTKSGSENCFFEHIASGSIIRASKNVEFPPHVWHDGKIENKAYDDTAVVKLAKFVPNVRPLQIKDMAINVSTESADLIIVSNYAENSPFKSKKALTII